MNRREFIATIIFIVSALFGLAVALLLVSEFFGLSSEAVRTICTSSARGINSCRTVAESPYALVGTFPLIGQIPTAALGVMFYSFAALLGMMNFYSKEKWHVRLSLGLVLSVTGLAADAALYLISIFKIKAVCTLCSISYCATFGMFASSIVALREFTISVIIESAKNHLFPPSRREVIALAFIVLLSIAAGIASTAITRHQFDAYARSRERSGELLSAYRSAKIHSIDITNTPFLGNPSAPIMLVLFIDFTCDHCLRAGKNVSSLVNEFPEKLVVRYKLYPLCGECPPQQGTSLEPCCIAALAASCAHKEGKFHAAYDALYADLEAGIDHSLESMQNMQKKIGLSDSFSSCITAFDTAVAINRDTEEGVRLHLTGTPALFINGRRIPNEYLHQQLLRELILHLVQ